MIWRSCKILSLWRISMYFFWISFALLYFRGYAFIWVYKHSCWFPQHFIFSYFYLFSRFSSRALPPIFYSLIPSLKNHKNISPFSLFSLFLFFPPRGLHIFAGEWSTSSFQETNKKGREKWNQTWEVCLMTPHFWSLRNPC